jgi:hypothetical protein
VRRTVTAAALTTALAACASKAVPVPGGAGAAPARGDTLGVQHAASPAAAFSGLMLRVRNGSVVVRAGSGDSVRVRLAVGAPIRGASTGKCRREQARATILRLIASGSEIAAQVDAGRDFGCLDYWEIEVPERFAVDVSGANASLRVAGVAGGVRAATAVGRIDVRVPGGAVEAGVRESGDVLVRVGSGSFGDAAVESRVGTAGLAVDGQPVAPLPGPGPGQRVEWRGAGRDRFTVRTEVGHARLELGPSAPPGASTAPPPT